MDADYYRGLGFSALRAAASGLGIPTYHRKKEEILGDCLHHIGSDNRKTVEESTALEQKVDEDARDTSSRKQGQYSAVDEEEDDGEENERDEITASAEQGGRGGQKSTVDGDGGNGSEEEKPQPDIAPEDGPPASALEAVLRMSLTPDSIKGIEAGHDKLEPELVNKMLNNGAKISENLKLREEGAEVVGEGKFGTVWEMLLGKLLVAVKFGLLAVLKEGEWRQHAATEVSLTEVLMGEEVSDLLEHPNVMRVLITGAVVFNTELHPKPLLVGVSVMERLGGGLLTRTSDVEYETCLAHDLLSALVHLKEAGLVHGDCREVNVCAGFMADGREVFKVVDFGLMTKVGVESTNRPPPRFCPPEVLDGRPFSRFTTDAYMVGEVLGERLIVGKAAQRCGWLFRRFMGDSLNGRTPVEVAKDAVRAAWADGKEGFKKHYVSLLHPGMRVHEDYFDLVTGMLSPDPEQRPSIELALEVVTRLKQRGIYEWEGGQPPVGFEGGEENGGDDDDEEEGEGEEEEEGGEEEEGEEEDAEKQQQQEKVVTRGSKRKL